VSVKPAAAIDEVIEVSLSRLSLYIPSDSNYCKGRSLTSVTSPKPPTGLAIGKCSLSVTEVSPHSGFPNRFRQNRAGGRDGRPS
jgi:hypothetical protein